MRFNTKDSEIKYYNKNINKVIKKQKRKSKEKEQGIENTASEHLKQVVYSYVEL